MSGRMNRPKMEKGENSELLSAEREAKASQKNIARSTLDIKGMSKEEVDRKIKFARDKDKEMVKGIFHFLEVPGGVLKFPFAIYPGDEIIDYTLKDGEVCSLPLGVAKHLNSCSYPEHKYLLDDAGNSVQRIGRKIKRCSFEPLDFTLDAEDIRTPADDIITVEKL